MRVARLQGRTLPSSPHTPSRPSKLTGGVQPEQCWPPFAPTRRARDRQRHPGQGVPLVGQDLHLFQDHAWGGAWRGARAVWDGEVRGGGKATSAGGRRRAPPSRSSPARSPRQPVPSGTGASASRGSLGVSTWPGRVWRGNVRGAWVSGGHRLRLAPTCPHALPLIDWQRKNAAPLNNHHHTCTTPPAARSGRPRRTAACSAARARAASAATASASASASGRASSRETGWAMGGAAGAAVAMVGAVV